MTNLQCRTNNDGPAHVTVTNRYLCTCLHTCTSGQICARVETGSDGRHIEFGGHRDIAGTVYPIQGFIVHGQLGRLQSVGVRALSGSLN